MYFSRQFRTTFQKRNIDNKQMTQFVTFNFCILSFCNIDFWLYALAMSRTCFRVNPHSIVAWMSSNSLSVRIRTKWFWVRVQLHLFLNLKILKIHFHVPPPSPPPTLKFILVSKIPQFLGKSYRFGQLIEVLERRHSEVTKNLYFLSTRPSHMFIF